jgi:branched-chain amino acid transport system substrate-binding protein
VAAIAIDSLLGQFGRRKRRRLGKGKIVGEEYTRWPDQLDFSAELSKIRAAKPDAVFVFYPGAAGVQFLNQYTQVGLKSQIPLYTAFTIDETTPTNP